MEVPTPKLPSMNSKYLEKHRAKVFFKHEIKDKRCVIGSLQLVDYFRKGAIPHLEYELDEECRSKGIMSKELPKYLKLLAKYDYNKLIALVDVGNAPSEKLLINNGFIYVITIGGKKSYVIDLRHPRKDIEFVTNVMAWHAENKRKAEERRLIT